MNFDRYLSYIGLIYLFLRRQISDKIQTDFLHITGALIEHFLEGIGTYYINPRVKNTFLLFQVNYVY